MSTQAVEYKPVAIRKSNLLTALQIAIEATRKGEAERGMWIGSAFLAGLIEIEKALMEGKEIIVRD